MKTNKMNSGLTLVDVRSVLMETIENLNSGKIDIEKAKVINELSASMINIAKTQVEYLKAIPNSVKEQMTTTEVKAIAGTLMDRDAEIEPVLIEVKENQKKGLNQ